MKKEQRSNSRGSVLSFAAALSRSEIVLFVITAAALALLEHVKVTVHVSRVLAYDGMGGEGGTVEGVGRGLSLSGGRCCCGCGHGLRVEAVGMLVLVVVLLVGMGMLLGLGLGLGLVLLMNEIVGIAVAVLKQPVRFNRQREQREQAPRSEIMRDRDLTIGSVA